MYSLDKLRMLEKEKARLEEAEIRRKKAEPPGNDPEGKRRKNRRIMAIYGRSEQDLVNASRSRTEEFLMESQASQSSLYSEDVLRPYTVHNHKFRDRNVEKEIGPPNGHVSGRTFIPRGFYRGGGELDPLRTASIEMDRSSLTLRSVKEIDETQPPPEIAQPSTANLDLAGIRGRLEQPPYRNPEYLLRSRDRTLEIGPPMKYRAKNDMERLTDTLGKVVLNGNGPWQPGIDNPEWKPVHKEKWKGQNTKLTHAPADILMKSVDGRNHPQEVNSTGDYKSVETVRNFYTLEGFRFRDKPREIGEEWSGHIPEHRYVKAKSKINFNYEWDKPNHYPTSKQFYNTVKSSNPTGTNSTTMLSEFHMSRTLNSL
mmetsp:Transcript_40082/g.52758  ORF Transcript_40082/g.52758 Transcript_40082/m.52758 type:complete len:370 (-) Transcript_40082:416-1525(-)